MNQHDMLFILTLCELLDKSVEPKEVERAYEEAKRKLEAHRQPTPEATFSRAPHR